MALDQTHDASVKSWLASANLAGSEFPIQNLPFSVFRRGGSDEPLRAGVAVGDQILDLAALATAGVLHGIAADAACVCSQPALNGFLAMGREAWVALRHALFARLQEGAKGQPLTAACMLSLSEADLHLPVRVGDYTDFYTSHAHALNVGRLVNSEPYAVPPNFHWLPIAYHGRASSLVVSGTGVRRPWGQLAWPGAQAPMFGPSQWLDYEIELGFYVGRGNALGQPIPIARAEEHLFGACLLNDWSSRDMQGWEMAPLGPFLSKSFATSLSPWIVTMDALEPFREGWAREPSLPGPPPHLASEETRSRGALDIRVEVLLETPRRREAGLGPVRLSKTSFSSQHWTVAQMLTHHTSAGCNLMSGDLLGTGTISGTEPAEAGSLIELSRATARPVPVGDEADGEQRTFLQDGDVVILKGACEREGFARIGFGECRGEVLATQAVAPDTSPALERTGHV